MFNTKEEFKYEFSKRIIESYGRTVEEAHLTEKFMVLETMVRDYASVNWAMTKMALQDMPHYEGPKQTTKVKYPAAISTFHFRFQRIRMRHTFICLNLLSIC